MTGSDPPKLRLVPHGQYSAKKSKLIGKSLELVERAEQGIATNPDHLDDRFDTPDGGMIDFSPQGWMIEFRRDERLDHPNEVELIDLIDVIAAANASRWPQDSD